MLEADIQRQILVYLKSKGYFCWRSNNAPIYDPTRKAFRAQGKWAPKGLPDICGVHKDGKAFFIEVKRPKGKLSADQRDFLETASRHEADTNVAYSLQDVKDAGF